MTAKQFTNWCGADCEQKEGQALNSERYHYVSRALDA